MKSGSIGKDIIHVVGIGLVLTVILTIISIGASFAINPAALNTASGTPGAANQVVIIPTVPLPTSTPTEIPCTAQEWWNSNSAAMGEIFSNARATTINTKVPEVQKAQAALKVWQTNFELADKAPPCVQAVKDAAIVSAKAANDLYTVYTTTSTEQQRAQQSVQLADKLLVLYDELDKAKVPVTDTWLVEAKDYTRGECPVARWYEEDFIAKGYNNFIKTNPKLDITKLTAAQKTDLLKQFRTLQSSLNTDKATFPDCVQKQLVDHLITYFKAGGDALNSALNNDLASIQGSLTIMPTELNNFYKILKTLDPKIVTQ